MHLYIRYIRTLFYFNHARKKKTKHRDTIKRKKISEFKEKYVCTCS